METVPGGTPVTANTARIVVRPLPAVTRYAVVDEKAWAGWSEKRELSGPKRENRAVAPPRRSALFTTQYSTPEVETSRRTLAVVTSAIVANHRPLEASNRTFGSLMKSVVAAPKNAWSVKVSRTVPCFVQMRPRAFTISTT